jgi:hypothetical protein
MVYFAMTLIELKSTAAKAALAAMLAAALLMQSAYAQPIPGQSPKEKAAGNEKKALEKQTDEQYKSTLRNIPAAGKPADPWGGIRTPNGAAAAGTK